MLDSASTDWLVAVCAIAVFAVQTHASPTISFPFNSQVPAVARVQQPYLFTFSESTFAAEATNFTYSLVEQPAWLQIDSVSRTLSGTPGAGDVGPDTFLLTATDTTGAANMQCTIVVSSDPAPQLEGDVGKQLGASANLSSSNPAIVTILPSTAFGFDLQPGSFIDEVPRKLYYYATLADHTPLPAWLSFDPVTLKLSGTAPSLSGTSQSWGIDVIASDVAGFAGATATFIISIGGSQLEFVPAEQTLSIAMGAPLDFQGLRNQLFRNGSPFMLSDLNNATASGLPSWLTFDAKTLDLEGTVPSTNTTDHDFRIIVTDDIGSSAEVTIYLVDGCALLFNGTIGNLTAYIGSAFTYQVPSTIFSEQDIDLQVTLPATATWLQFDAQTRHLKGTVPGDASPTVMLATLTAHVSHATSVQTQVFQIDVVGASSSTSLVASRASSTNSSTSRSSASPATADQAARPHTSGGVVAAIVVLSLVAAALLSACLILCCRRRKREIYERDARIQDKSIISRPMTHSEAGAITVTTDMYTDIEKTADDPDAAPAKEYEPAPRIALDFPTQSNERSTWVQPLSHLSQTSSLGNGEDAIRADHNIPEWGQGSARLNTPHESFFVPHEMARRSRPAGRLSPTKRMLKRLRTRPQSSLSAVSTGFGIGFGDGVVISALGLKQSRGRARDRSSFGLSATMDRSSQTSLSTRGTSLLSTRPSDFPQPPSTSTIRLSRPAPVLSVTDAEQRNTIRLVSAPDGLTDNRPLADKRQSYIRNRASSIFLASPLFAHGSRALSGQMDDESRSRTTSLGTNARYSRRSTAKPKTYSVASPIEPAAVRESRLRHTRRLSSRVRSAFGPNFPRAITRSSSGADDEGGCDGDESSSDYYTTESSVSGGVDVAAELALPRNQRSWVLPGEASPTPPPVPPPPPSRRSSTGTHSTDFVSTRRDWRTRMHERSSSPLASATTAPVSDSNSWSSRPGHTDKKNSLSEPLNLVSSDSLSRAKAERSRLAQTSNFREPKRFESSWAESGNETDPTQAGSETWEDCTDVEGTGMIPAPLAVGSSKKNTQRSDRTSMSGLAFL